MQLGFSDEKNIRQAYLLLKRQTYYEQIDLFLRAAIAKYDNDEAETQQQKIGEFLKGKDLTNQWFTQQLKSIDAKYIPKKIKNEIGKKNEPKPPTDVNNSSDGEEKGQTKNHVGNFITNLRTQEEYPVEEINYFFSGNISLYILCMLWSMLVGPYLDNALSKDCYGNRLDVDEEKHEVVGDYKLFKLYIHQYNNWRDGAIQAGIDSLEKHNDVLLIALDFKQCYYHLPINWLDLQKFIEENISEDKREMALFLTKVVEKIHAAYYEKTRTYLGKTHNFNSETKLISVIPVGLPSSHILANWELKKFDEIIQRRIRPSFYGRYVDDVLIVINNPDKEVAQQGVYEILREYFFKNGIIDEKPVGEHDTLYKIMEYDDLYIQNSKIIIHYYNHEHSWAGLKEFKEELKQKASEFRFLPEEDQYKDLVDEAYDIQYDGSVYRFRSVIGISENATKLSHYIYKQQLKYWLCNDIIRDKTIDEIFRFYRGKNIFDYFKLWERVFTLFIVSQKYRDFYQFNRDLEKVIQKLTFKSDNTIAKKLIDDCKQYKKIAASMAIGYLGESISKESTSLQFLNFVKDEFCDEKSLTQECIVFPLNSLPFQLRNSLLLRHQNMFWPLLDYSNFKGNLTKLDWSHLGDGIQIVDGKIQESTRFIQPDEIQLITYLQNILRLKSMKSDASWEFRHFQELLHQDKKKVNPSKITSQDVSKNSGVSGGTSDELLRNFEKFSSPNINSERHEDDNLPNAPIRIHTLIKSSKARRKKICIGIVNLKVNEKDIEASYNPRKKPNNNYERQKDLFALINQGLQKPACDLIVFPEVSIPFAWLPFMVNQSRRNDIGFVFGLEHVVSGPYALNLVATILPYKNEAKHNCVYLSLRLKNHYSPRESHELGLFNLHRPHSRWLYEKFSWDGVVFSVFNCYELTDINHRGLFRSDIDLLIAVEYNSDINYFSNIIEAVARDVHCYAVQSNSSDYGDSRIISPQITEKMNVIRVKGGDNAVLLKTTLDIEALRDFQSREYSPSHNEFKPTPAGYEHEKARVRK